MIDEIKRERKIAAETRFYYTCFWGDKSSKHPHAICDAVRPTGKKAIAKFNNKLHAELFLKIVRARYVKHGEQYDELPESKIG